MKSVNPMNGAIRTVEHDAFMPSHETAQHHQALGLPGRWLTLVGGLPAALLVGLLAGVPPTLGQTWKQTTTPNLDWSAIAASSDGANLVAVAPGFPAGFIYLSTNYGTIWTQATGPVGAWTSVASSADGTKLVVVGNDFPTGPVYVSADAGATWTQSPAPASPWTAVASSADGAKLVIVSDLFPTGPVYVSSDSGATWTVSPAPMASWKAVASSADGNRLIIVADNYPDGPVYTSADAGATWTQAEVPPNAWTAAACSADGTWFHIAANNPPNGPIFSSWNSGTNWERPFAPADNYSALACTADGLSILAASSFTNGVGGILYRYDTSWFEDEWKEVPTPIQTWSAVACSTDGSNLVATVRGGGIYRWETLPPEPPPAYLFSIGPFEGTNFFKPVDVAMDANGVLYIAEAQISQWSVPRVLAFGRDGTVLRMWDVGGIPGALAIDRNNNIYVTDLNNGRVIKFDTNGTVLALFEPFYFPEGVAVDGNGDIYVADVYADRISGAGTVTITKLSSSGERVTQWTPLAAFGRWLTARLAVDTTGNVYLSTSQENPKFNRVEKFSPNGTLLLRWGRQGPRPGYFTAGPLGMAIDGTGSVFIADWGGQLRRYSSDADPLSQWGTNGSGLGEFVLPSGVTLDRMGNRVYVADRENARIQVFAYPNAEQPIINRFTRMVDGRFRIQFDGAAGMSYTVAVSTNLTDWTPLGPATEPISGHFEFTDSDAPNHPTRFYQLRSP